MCHSVPNCKAVPQLKQWLAVLIVLLMDKVSLFATRDFNLASIGNACLLMVPQ